MWFIGVEEEQETSAPPPKKNPGSAPGSWCIIRIEKEMCNSIRKSLYKDKGQNDRYNDIKL